MRSWEALLKNSDWAHSRCALDQKTVDALNALESLRPASYYTGCSDDYRTLLLSWLSWAEGMGLITQQERNAICRDIWGNGSSAIDDTLDEAKAEKASA